MKAKSEKRRPFIGNQIEECRDISGIFYILSFTKGKLLKTFTHLYLANLNFLRIHNKLGSSKKRVRLHLLDRVSSQLQRHQTDYHRASL